MRDVNELKDYMTKAIETGFDSCDESIYLRGKFVEDCFYWLPKLIPAYERFNLETQISIIWSIEDVQDVNDGLTNEEAFEVLKALKRYHDANYGVNWDTIRATISHMYPDIKGDSRL